LTHASASRFFFLSCRSKMDASKNKAVSR
jgi:hypothetical protein